MEEREKLDLIEERLRVVEGFGDYPFADMAELCLVPDVVIPPKFKVPDFDEIKFLSSFHCQRWPLYEEMQRLQGAGLRCSCGVGLRNSIKRRPLGGEQGI